MLKLPIYLDYNATTPVDPEVLEAMLPYFSEHFGNAASRTHAFGWIAADAVDYARMQVAELIHAEKEEIIFTSGATESINLAMKGLFESYRSKGSHIVTASTEHRAVLDTCRALERNGADVTYLPVNREGMIDLQQLEDSISSATVLVCLMHANNETGVIHPVKDIANIVHAKGSIFMTDATQTCGKIQADVQEDGIDLMCMSAHKLYGPKGVGVLYVRRKNPRVHLMPLIDGGGHERGLRAGTLNVPGIVGLGKACELAGRRLWGEGEKISYLRTRLEQALTDTGRVFVNGSVKHRLPGVTNLCVTHIRSEVFLKKLQHIAVSTGSACTSAEMHPSHVLKAMGLSDEESLSSVRFSLGRFTTSEEVEYALQRIISAM